jgi:hypothetical protein
MPPLRTARPANHCRVGLSRQVRFAEAATPEETSFSEQYASPYEQHAQITRSSYFNRQKFAGEK